MRALHPRWLRALAVVAVVTLPGAVQAFPRVAVSEKMHAGHHVASNARLVVATADGPAPNSSAPSPAPAASPDTESSSGWSPSAVTAADAVAGRMRGTGLACDEYFVHDHARLARDYRDRLPLPLALASCQGAEDDLEIAVFADAGAKGAFIEAKRALLCATAARKGVRFAGFPYVDGGTWTIQPDVKATADEIAAALGATAHFVRCGGS